MTVNPTNEAFTLLNSHISFIYSTYNYTDCSSNGCPKSARDGTDALVVRNYSEFVVVLVYQYRCENLYVTVDFVFAENLLCFCIIWCFRSFFSNSGNTRKLITIQKVFEVRIRWFGRHFGFDLRDDADFTIETGE